MGDYDDLQAEVEVVEKLIPAKAVGDDWERVIAERIVRAFSGQLRAGKLWWRRDERIAALDAERDRLWVSVQFLELEAKAAKAENAKLRERAALADELAAYVNLAEGAICGKWCHLGQRGLGYATWPDCNDERHDTARTLLARHQALTEQEPSS